MKQFSGEFIERERREEAEAGTESAAEACVPASCGEAEGRRTDAAGRAAGERAQAESDEDPFSGKKLQLLAEIEALLFAAADGLTEQELAALLECREERIVRALEELEASLAGDDRRGLMLRKIRRRYSLSTRRELNPLLAKLYAERPLPKLTKAAYEVLAAVAYNEPCTRLQIEEVRGVNSDSVLARLLELNLIEQSGVLDVIGRPALYSVSDYFLRSFGLRSAAELPTMELLQYDSIKRFEASAREAGAESIFHES